MATMFSDEQRQLQDRFDTRRLADRIEDLLHTPITYVSVGSRRDQIIG